jgi:hypothetical protein
VNLEQLEFMPSITVAEVLAIISDEAMKADKKAEEACIKSKYSVQDYWMCLQFNLSSLHDRIARAAKLPTRCPRGRFSQALLEFKRQTMLRSGRLLEDKREGAIDELFKDLDVNNE